VDGAGTLFRSAVHDDARRDGRQSRLVASTRVDGHQGLVGVGRHDDLELIDPGPGGCECPRLDYLGACDGAVVDVLELV
jgi:hypothetical protein